MSKIKIKYSIKNPNEIIENECLGIIKNNKISYNDNNVLTTINIDTLEFIRKSNDYEIKILFNDNICYITTNEGKLNSDLKLKTKEIDINKLYIEYILANEIYCYKIEYEVF